jgi:hypothetical protein
MQRIARALSRLFDPAPDLPRKRNAVTVLYDVPRSQQVLDRKNYQSLIAGQSQRGGRFLNRDNGRVVQVNSRKLGRVLAEQHGHYPVAASIALSACRFG